MHEPAPEKHPLADVVREAWIAGERIDLRGAGYGRQHWGDTTAIARDAPAYYRTLAGFAALFGAKSAIEIGTHWGGSAIAIMRGMDDPEARLITIDITDESDQYLPHQPEASRITKLQGNANDSEIVARVQAMIERVDLLYVDAMHTANATLANFCIYGALFKPKLALFDDITLPGTNMSQFWRIMRGRYPENTINCAEVLPETRGPNKCGFGLWVAP